jgi:hypothetical protein
MQLTDTEGKSRDRKFIKRMNKAPTLAGSGGVVSSAVPVNFGSGDF